MGTLIPHTRLHKEHLLHGFYGVDDHASQSVHSDLYSILPGHPIVFSVHNEYIIIMLSITENFHSKTATHLTC